MDKQQKVTKKDILRLSNKESNQITKESLAIALIKLMSKKNFKDITITELVRCAGVSRTAFYRNYTEKEDILRELSYKTTEELKKSLDLDKYKNNLYLWLIDYFNIIKKNANFIQILLKTNYPNITLYDFLDYYALSYGEYSIDNYYKFLFFTSGLNSITFQWIKNGLKESSEKMASICMEVISNQSKKA